ncbi:RNA polymerase sigma factor [Pseudobacter ginsenosidimutans]|uniref:RNA polymerase sigma-70 factor (ECF subfamily) n=1 Tax=Pseudobacter ginsenosidimutans TaxID=661488 RepID=A0A4Q7MLF1_9BACT|nr:sigma-70 family RNA polymerase sigma factor [Pseudobacter ginsenosidimutans]QEC40274.1 sigma-70 family RNA polymerase sigma factor [Pseudobacter ginsenosidimutans]RZS69124.1 RNA polymerase sigma-70 factor (ECF subfamily) [Pseudobacter ginsenosidimutans]
MNYYLPTETELIDAFHRSDQRADRLLFNRHFRALCVYAENIVGNMQEAEDLVVIVFQKMMAMRMEFQSSSGISAFLYTSTRNAALNANRNNKQRTLAKERFMYLEPIASSQKDSGQNEIIMIELLSHIYQEMENLPHKCRTIFKLYFLQQMSSDEIAGSLGISPQTARTQKARAIQLLRIRVWRKAQQLIDLVLIIFLLQ